MRSLFAIAFSALLLGACAVDAPEAGPDAGGADLTSEADDFGEAEADIRNLPQCSSICTLDVPCDTRCNDREGSASTCDETGRCTTGDVDGDGVLVADDNCPRDYNPGQADCDWDGRGDVCDAIDGNYQVQSQEVCYADEDGFPLWGTIEMYGERTLVDVSSCGGAPRYERYLHDEIRCFNLSPRRCCELAATNPLEMMLCNNIGHEFCPNT